jgi:dolichol-phosphate mannosyltransferase
VDEIIENWDNAIELQIISLSRNFGYESGVIAGLEFADSDLYAVVDGDGEDPISLLPKFLDEILAGADIVQGLRLKRQEARSLQMFRRISYSILSKVSDDPFQANAGNFSMFRRIVRDGIVRENTIFPFMRATLSRIGYSVVQIPHDRNQRIGGISHYRKSALIKFAILGFMTSTTWPLRFTMYWAVGVLFTTLSLFGISLIVDLSTNFWIKLLILGVVQVQLFLGVIAIYIARIYKFVIGRPQYYYDLTRSYSNIE